MKCGTGAFLVAGKIVSISENNEDSTQTMLKTLQASTIYCTRDSA